MKEKNRAKLSTLDEVRYDFDWLDLSKQFKELEVLHNQADDAFMLDTRVTNSYRQCRIIFLKNGVKIGHFTFASGYGKDIIEDFINSDKSEIYEVLL